MAKKKAKKGGKKKKKKKASRKKKRALQKGGSKEIRQEKEKGGKKEKGDESRHTHGQHGGTDGACASSTVGRWNHRRATRAESSSRVAFPDGVPALGPGTRRKGASSEALAWPSKLSGPARVQSAQER